MDDPRRRRRVSGPGRGRGHTERDAKRGGRLRPARRAASGGGVAMVTRQDSVIVQM